MSNLNYTVLQILNEIEQEMQCRSLWQDLAPNPEAFLSEQPFSLDRMSGYEWLQWVFLPKMRELIVNENNIPRGFALSPYFEEALKEEQEALALLSLLKQLDLLVKE